MHEYGLAEYVAERAKRHAGEFRQRRLLEAQARIAVPRLAQQGLTRVVAGGIEPARCEPGGVTPAPQPTSAVGPGEKYCSSRAYMSSGGGWSSQSCAYAAA